MSSRLRGGAISVVLVAVSVVGAVPAGAARAPSPPVSHNEAFVIAVYQDFVGRAPTPAELAQASSMRLSTVAERAFALSGTSSSTVWVRATVNKLYLDTLGRTGDAAGLDYWVDQLQAGELSVAAVAANFYSSSEYFTGFGGSNLTKWIKDLYLKVLLRTGDAAGVNYWVRVAGVKGRASVAYAIYQSTESRQTRVIGLYERLLGRQPDQGGRDYWAYRIRAVGDLKLAEQLASSAEYYQRAFDALPSTPHGWQVLAPPTGALAGGIITVVGTTSNGTIVGTVTVPDPNPLINHDIEQGLVWSSAAATPTVLAVPDGITNVTAAGVTPSGLIVGTKREANGLCPCQGLVWTSPSATATVLQSPDQYTVVNGVNAAGVIFGGNKVWATATDAPTVVETPLDYIGTDIAGVTEAGVVYGTAQDVQHVNSHGIVWASTTASPDILRAPTGLDQQVTLAGVTSEGVVVGWSIGAADALAHPQTWATVTASPTQMAVPDGFLDAFPTGVTPDGRVYGGSTVFDSAVPGTRHQGISYASVIAVPTILATPPEFTGVSVQSVGSTSIYFGTLKDAASIARTLIFLP